MTHLAAIVGVLVISFSAILVRLAGVTPDTSAFFRTLYALPILLILWLKIDRSDRSGRSDPAGRPPRLRLLAFLSGVILGLDLAFWHRAIDWIGAGLATVLGNSQVIFVGLAAWLVHKERPRRSLFASVPLAFLGMLFVSGLNQPEAYGVNPIRGTLFGVFTGIAYASFLLLFRASTHDRPSPVGPLLDATVGACLAAGAIGLASGRLDFAWSWPAHGWLIALALGSQVVGWLFIAYALPRLPAVETSFLLLLQPMATVLWASIIFAEDLSGLQWLGVILVVSGISLPSLSLRTGTADG
jgi:drug/metabolite transporter (DMT)-like permease